jgi:antitoxin component YwqK of YwqJK toxin-antitoxin module
MNKFKHLTPFYFLALMILVSCEVEHDADSSTQWKGTESAFSEDFDLVDSTDSGAVLVSRASSEKFSGNIERNQSGVITEQTYLGGKLSGRSIKKSPDGSWVEVNYIDGKLHGPMTLYSRTGKVRSVMNYSNGKLIPSTISGAKEVD